MRRGGRCRAHARLLHPTKHKTCANTLENTRPNTPDSQRTVLMYLSTPEEGGETVFPDAEFKSTGESH